MKNELTVSPAAERILLFSLALVALLLQCLPSLAEALQWQRSASFPTAAITSVTGHFAHWSWDHLLWDLAAFLGLGLAANRLLPGRLMLCLVVSSFAIPIEIFLMQPHLETYRGLSGIDSALFGWLLVGLWQQGRIGKCLSAAGCAGFAGKLLFEFLSGSTLFVDCDAEFIPATSAHFVGFVAGIVSSLTKKPNRVLAIPATT